MRALMCSPCPPLSAVCPRLALPRLALPHCLAQGRVRRPRVALPRCLAQGRVRRAAARRGSRVEGHEGEIKKRSTKSNLRYRETLYKEVHGSLIN